MIQSKLISSLLLSAVVFFLSVEGRTVSKTDDSINPVLPSPNQDMGDASFFDGDIKRVSSAGAPVANVRKLEQSDYQQLAASDEATVPVYISPFVRAEKGSQASRAFSFERQESSQAPPNYAPGPVASASASPQVNRDLKASASYGHHHHGGHHGGHHGYDSSGWLDMGAWTGGKGSFGWYADYPVGGKHHYGYGKR